MATDPLRPDTDGDKMRDGDEMTAGTDPLSASSFFWVESIVSNIAGGVVISWQSVPGRLYSVYACTALASYVWTATDYTNVPGTGGIRSYTNFDADPLEFFMPRVKMAP